MKSIAFPKMFNSTSTNLIEDRDATISNLKLLLTSEKGELIGDPYFGTKLKRYLFEQNSVILKDILIDDIYDSISTFMPQLTIQRKDITITIDKEKLYCNIKAINKKNFSLENYNLVLFDGGEQ